MTEPIVWRVSPGLYLIDHRFQGVPSVIGSYLLSGDDGLALIETGPSTTIDTLLAGIRSLDYDPADVTALIVTHIHLDHSGAAGALLAHMPRARVIVHPNGATHLIDPSRLLRSAARIFGDDMDRLWGDVVPVPEERVQIVQDGESFKAAGRTLTAHSTPGHAGHHHAFFDLESGDLFTGDAAGVRLEAAPYVRPPTVPPEFDPDVWRATIGRMRALRPRMLHLTHFGSFDDPDWHFDDLLCRLYYWYGWAVARLAQDTDEATLVRELQEFGDREIVEITGSADLAVPYELATPYGMTVTGMGRYYHRQARRDGETRR